MKSNDADEFTFHINNEVLNLKSLTEQMNEQFKSLYRYYYNNESFDVDLFRKSASIFFDAHLDLKSHDRFFNNFTILWQMLIRNGSFFFAEQIWERAVQTAKDWEALNPSRSTIHKGAAYYFWAVTCILKEDLEKGFLLMHEALEEDRRNRSNELTITSAYAFVKLDYKQQHQYFIRKVNEITEFLEEKLKIYRSSRNGNLSLDQLKSAFMDNLDLVDQAFLFVYELLHIKKLLSETNQGLTQNAYGSILMINVIFTFILVIDNVIKQKYNDKDPRRQDFANLISYLLNRSNLAMDLSKLKVINERANTDLEAVILDLLKAKLFKNGKLKQIENDIGIVYTLRNSAAHRIRDRPFIYENFQQITDRLFNIFFLTIEKLYMPDLM
jgi:transcription antitermination factor NusG